MRHTSLACVGTALIGLGCNQPPSVPQVVIEPAAPSTADELVATLVVPASDRDGDDLIYGYGWFRGDDTERVHQGATLPASYTAKHETWRVLVTASDGSLGGPPVEASTTILNSPPVATVSVWPTEATSYQDISATVTTSDADDDPVSVTYLWLRDGSPSSYTNPTLPSLVTQPGEIWTVQVIPSDDEVSGEIVYADATVVNSAPVITGVEIAPEEPKTGTEIVAYVGAYDLDDDALEVSVSWTVDGVEVAGESDTVLPAGTAPRGSVVQAAVTVSDGELSDGPFASNELTVVNTAPSLDSVAVSPEEIYRDSTATCAITGWHDDDSGDPQEPVYSWWINGSEVGHGATLALSTYDRGDSVRCGVQPCDDEACGTEKISSNASILNHPPELASATLSHGNPTEADVVSVVLGAISDDDGDAVSLYYEWYVNGARVATSETISGAHFDRGDTVYCRLTPTDGFDVGTEVTTSMVTVANSAPTIDSISLSPSELYTDSVLGFTVDASDLDGDAVTTSIQWLVDEYTVGVSTGDLDGDQWFDKGQIVQVELTPSDGVDSGSPVLSAPITVLNSPPEPPGISVVPALALEGEALRCGVDVAASDADGDSIDYDIAWSVDGVAFTGATTATLANDTIPEGVVLMGESWSCTVTPHDGEEPGSSATAWAEVSCDLDGDGYDDPICGGEDCDDGDPTVSPGIEEVCGDGIDNDCDGTAIGCGLEGELLVDDADAIFLGAQDGDRSGACFATGDLNGDGWLDTVIGAPYESSVANDQGAVFAVFGPSSGTVDLALADAVLLGEIALDYVARALASHDLDGDGYDDLIIGSSGLGSSDLGGVYLVHGPVSGTSSLADNDTVLRGEDSSGAAGYVLALGDLDGDWTMDVIVGAPYADEDGTDSGALYVVPGDVVAGDHSLPSVAGAKLIGEGAGDVASFSLSSGCDVDGDGLDDLLVGAPYDDRGGRDAGAVYLLHGPLSGTIDLVDADAILFGMDPGDALGYAASLQGDLDEDGFDDIAVGAAWSDAADPSAGQVYVLTSAPSGTASVDTWAHASLLGEDNNNWAGASVLITDDVDGDTRDDLAIAAPYQDAGATQGGAVYLVTEIHSGVVGLGTASAKIVGTEAYGLIGARLASAGDTNGDGLTDILVGNDGSDLGGADAGATFLFTTEGL